MYGYDYMYGPSSSVSVLAFILSLLAFIAAIVVTVVLYKKFIAIDDPTRLPGTKRDWGSFFRFEHLIIENILKVLYLFIACLIAFECAATVLSSLPSIIVAPGQVIGGVILCMIAFIVLEVINRLWFEFALLIVLIWKNTSALRKASMGDDPTMPSSDSAAPSGKGPSGYTVPPVSQFVSQIQHGPAPQPPYSYDPASHSQPSSMTGSRPESYVSHHVNDSVVSSEHSQKNISSKLSPTPTMSISSSDSPWTCQACGAFNKSGDFCAQCGTRRNV